MSYFCLYLIVFQSLAWLDTWDCFEHHCTFISAVWQRNRPRFVALLGIHVALCFDDVFLSVNVSLLVFHVYHSLLFLLKLNKQG